MSDKSGADELAEMRRDKYVSVSAVVQRAEAMILDLESQLAAKDRRIEELEPPRCHDCDVAVGELHEEGCDIERCFDCGGQRISCGCEHPSEHRVRYGQEADATIHHLETRLATERARADKAEAGLAAAELELERWRHGVTVEGDFVCPNELRAVNVEQELDEARRIAVEECAARFGAEDDVEWKRSEAFRLWRTEGSRLFPEEADGG